MASFLLWQQSLSSSHSFIPARQFQSPAPEITVDPKWLQNVLRPLRQQGSQIGIAFNTDVHLGLALAGVSPSWLQSQITTHVAALAKTMWGFQREQEGQRDQRAYALHLLQQQRRNRETGAGALSASRPAMKKVSIAVSLVVVLERARRTHPI